MKAARILREKIRRDDQVTTGMLCTFHFWPGMVELAIRAGLDYLIIDLEHHSFDASMVAEACAIGRRQDFAILIRPPAAEFTSLRLAMDLGPCGLLVPAVANEQTMKTIQDAVYMPPRGRRRPGGMGNHWVSNVDYETWRAGPYDLSADLGVCWNPEAGVFLEALEQIRRAGRNAGKPMWMIGDGPELVQQGFRFVCIGEPTCFLQAKLTELNERVTRIGDGRE